MRRLFFGYPLTESERTALSERLLLPFSQARLRMIPAEKWHITLAFLGELSDEAIDSLLRSLPTLELPMGEPMNVNQASAFPSPAQARTLWVGQETPAPALQSQYLTLRKHLTEQQRIKPQEKRELEYFPHLTLTRLKDPRNLSWALSDMSEKLKQDPILLGLQELHLYESVTLEGAHEYRSLWQKSF